MSTQKILTISNDDVEKSFPVNVLKVHKDYKLSDLLDVNMAEEGAQAPVFFVDLDRNLNFCALNKIDNEQKSEIENTLRAHRDQFIQASLDYSNAVCSIEEALINYLRSKSENFRQSSPPEHSDDIFNPLEVKFKNNKGEALIRIKIAFPCDENGTLIKEHLNQNATSEEPQGDI